MTMNAAHTRGPRRPAICPTDPQSEPITEADTPTDGEPTCEHVHPDCPAIRCQRRPHGTDGLCWRVRTRPYRADYWQATA